MSSTQNEKTPKRPRAVGRVRIEVGGKIVDLSLTREHLRVHIRNHLERDDLLIPLQQVASGIGWIYTYDGAEYGVSCCDEGIAIRRLEHGARTRMVPVKTIAWYAGYQFAAPEQFELFKMEPPGGDGPVESTGEGEEHSES